MGWKTQIIKSAKFVENLARKIQDPAFSTLSTAYASLAKTEAEYAAKKALRNYKGRK